MIKKWKQLAHCELCELAVVGRQWRPGRTPKQAPPEVGDVDWTNHDHLKAPSLETITRQSVNQGSKVVLRRRDGVGLHQVWFERVTKVSRIAGKVLVAFWKRCVRATLLGAGFVAVGTAVRGRKCDGGRIFGPHQPLRA
jgi:hypothetical protein